MNDLVKFVPNFIAQKDAIKLVEYAKLNDDLFLEFGNSEKEFTFHFNFLNNDIKQLIQKYQRLVHDFVTNEYNITLKPYNETKTHIARFTVGHGMHEHFDSSKPNDIATLLYLNDDYLGGEIYFPELDIFIKPGSGDLLCFPDTPSFVHGVKPILSGTRYTAPYWFTRII